VRLEKRYNMAKKESYIKSSYDELMNKVSWPTWSELQSSSIVVAIASAIIALIIFLMDYIMGTNSSDAYWKGFLGYFYSFFS
jgi:preprotein translocase subunit SecE